MTEYTLRHETRGRGPLAAGFAAVAQGVDQRRLEMLARDVEDVEFHPDLFSPLDPDERSKISTRQRQLEGEANGTASRSRGEQSRFTASVLARAVELQRDPDPVVVAQAAQIAREADQLDYDIRTGNRIGPRGMVHQFGRGPSPHQPPSGPLGKLTARPPDM